MPVNPTGWSPWTVSPQSSDGVIGLALTPEEAALIGLLLNAWLRIPKPPEGAPDRQTAERLSARLKRLQEELTHGRTGE